VEDGAGRVGPVVEVGPQTFGNGEDELADWDVGEDVVHHVGGGRGLPTADPGRGNLRPSGLFRHG